MKDVYIDKSRYEYTDKLLELLFLAIAAVYMNGKRAVFVILITTGAYVVTDVLLSVLFERRRSSGLEFLFVPVSMSLMLSAGVPYYVPVIAGIFAFAVGQLPFGSSGRQPFSPACVGIAFVNACFYDEVNNFTQSARGESICSASIASLLKNGSCLNIDKANIFDVLSGNVPSPMGTGFIIILLACVIFTLLRNKKILLPLVGYISVIALCVLIFPGTQAVYLNELINELCSGAVLYCAIFFLCDEDRAPKNSIKKLLYGAVAGAALMIMKKTGSFEDPSCFAVLLANSLSGVIEKNEN